MGSDQWSVWWHSNIEFQQLIIWRALVVHIKRCAPAMQVHLSSHCLSIRFFSSGWELPRLTDINNAILAMPRSVEFVHTHWLCKQFLVANPTMLPCFIFKSNLKKWKNPTNSVQHCHLHTEQVQRTAPLRCHRGQPEQQIGNETKLTADRNPRIRPHRDTRVESRGLVVAKPNFLPWPAPVERKHSFTLLKMRCSPLATNNEPG